MIEAILVLNAGSSSIKFSVYHLDTSDPEELVMRYDGQIEGIGTAPRFVVRDAAGNRLLSAQWEASGTIDSGHAVALEHLGAWLQANLTATKLVGVGHRIVHGGPDYSAPVVITPDVLPKLESYIPLAPLHQPYCLAGVRAVLAQQPDLLQVGSFDTAFHRTQPLVAEQFAIPYAFYDEGVRRYGFHGISYAYIARTLPVTAPEIAQGRVVVAHLGNGASMCAMHDGRSVASTMGFTALDGLPMGTRCGSIDPGVLLYWINNRGMAVEEVEELLYKRSGLLGLSGISNDMRVLQASDDPRAAQAIDYFVYRIQRGLGDLAAALGGLDGVVFTAGIGENAADIRAQVCQQSAWLGIELDEEANRQRGPRISTPTSRVSVWVIPTDEEKMIALDTLAALRSR